MDTFHPFGHVENALQFIYVHSLVLFHDSKKMTGLTKLDFFPCYTSLVAQTDPETKYFYMQTW